MVAFLDETGIIYTRQFFTLTGLHKLLDFLFIWLYVFRINEMLGKMDIVLRGYHLL